MFTPLRLESYLALPEMLRLFLVCGLLSEFSTKAE
jgi:hypothetical protein